MNTGIHVSTHAPLGDIVGQERRTTATLILPCDTQTADKPMFKVKHVGIPCEGERQIKLPEEEVSGTPHPRPAHGRYKTSSDVVDTRDVPGSAAPAASSASMTTSSYTITSSNSPMSSTSTSSYKDSSPLSASSS